MPLADALPTYDIFLSRLEKIPDGLPEGFIETVKQLCPSFTIENKAEFVTTRAASAPLNHENRFDKTFVDLVKSYKKAANQLAVELAEAAIKEYMKDQDIYDDHCPDDAHFKAFCKGLDVDHLDKDFVLHVGPDSTMRQISTQDVFVLGN